MHNTLLLVAVNARYSHPNLALFSLRTCVADLGHRTVIREFTINDSDDAIVRGIVAEEPAIVALSAYIWNARCLKRIIPRIGTALPHARIILGGPEASYTAHAWLADFPRIDCIVAGHGETGFRRLVSGETDAGERIITIPNTPFDEIPFPYRDEDFADHNLGVRNVYYESSRGCPFRCAYCLSSRSDQRLEFRDPERVFDEIDRLMRHRPRLIKFVDRTFNARPERAITLWEGIAARYDGSGTRFHFEVHPALLDDDTLRALAGIPAGLFQFELGIQSAHDTTIEAIGRSGRWERVRESIARLRESGNMHLHADMIAGLPGEDADAVRRSFNAIYALGADHFQLGFLKVLPGTRLADEAALYGIAHDPEPPYAIIESARLSRDGIAGLHAIDRLVNALHNTGRFVTTLAALMEEFSDPFAAYRALADHARETAQRPPDRAWEPNAALILDFAAAHLPHRRGYLRDCLAWDWCATTRTHVYPAMLKRGEAAQARKSFYKSIERGDPAAPVMIGDCALSRDELRATAFFHAATDEFRARRMRGHPAALHLRAGRGGPRVVYLSSIS